MTCLIVVWWSKETADDFNRTVNITVSVVSCGELWVNFSLWGLLHTCSVLHLIQTQKRRCVLVPVWFILAPPNWEQWASGHRRWEVKELIDWTVWWRHPASSGNEGRVLVAESRSVCTLLETHTRNIQVFNKITNVPIKCLKNFTQTGFSCDESRQILEGEEDECCRWSVHVISLCLLREWWRGRLRLRRSNQEKRLSWRVNRSESMMDASHLLFNLSCWERDDAGGGEETLRTEDGMKM